MDFLLFLIGLFILIYAVDKIYGKINLRIYSPKWEYFCKAFLYGVIMVLTLMYGKNSLQDVSSLEWVVAMVSFIEGMSNYIQYIKETKRQKETSTEIK